MAEETPVPPKNFKVFEVPTVAKTWPDTRLVFEGTFDLANAKYEELSGKNPEPKTWAYVLTTGDDKFLAAGFRGS